MGGTPVTPSQVRNRDPDSLFESATARTVEMIRLFRTGVCSECGGVVDVDVEPHPTVAGSDEPSEFVAVGRCRECWWRLNAPPSLWLATHPAAVAFHWDHGVDVTSLGPRAVGERLDDGRWRTEQAATEPPEFEVTYRADQNVLRLTVDDNLDLLRSERVRRDSVD
jgi:hypothetical protein